MEFDKQKFADLLRLALGDRSINQYGRDCSVDPGYISRLLRKQKQTPPSAEIIKKFAGRAYNAVNAEQLFEAAGYIDTHTDNDIRDERKPKDLQKILAEHELLFSGTPLDEEDKEEIYNLIQYRLYKRAKELNKRKPAPKGE